MQLGKVAVTGANGQVGRELLQQLIPVSAKVSALVRKNDTFPGCEVVPDWMRSEAGLVAMRQADAVVHLAGTLNPPDHDYESANIAPTRRVAAAVAPDTTKRLIFLSYVGADVEAKNSYLATKARAEQILKQTGVPLVVIRCTHIIGSPERPGPTARTMLQENGKAVTVLGNGKQRVAPVYVGDVASSILAALRTGQDGTFELQGPQTMTLDDLVRLLNNDSVRISHVPGLVARLLRFIGPKLPGPLIDVMLDNSTSSNPCAAKALGVQLTGLDSVWGKR